MHSRQIGQSHIRPIVAAGSQQSRPRFARIGIAQWIVVSKNRRSTVQSALMGRNYVAERRALIRHVIPRERKSPILWSVSQKQIRHHPGPVLKLTYVRRWILPIRTNHVTAQELRRREYYVVRVKTNGALALVIDGDHIDSIFSLRIIGNDLSRREPKSHFRFRFFVKVRDQAGVSLGP